MINLVPFGLSISSNKMLDVHDVVQGKTCACICPSCKMPLIAVKGTNRAWHFRHNSKAENNGYQECKYSLFVSLRFMAKELIGESVDFTTPNYLINGKSVTKSRAIKINNIRHDAKFEKTTVDILGETGGRNFVIYFTHPGRQIPTELLSVNDGRCGIVEIKMDDWGRFFSESAAGPEKTYSDTLFHLITKEVNTKRWIYHPRQHDIRTLVSQESTKNDDGVRSRRCFKCNHEWRSLIAKCPICHEQTRITTV